MRWTLVTLATLSLLTACDEDPPLTPRDCTNANNAVDIEGPATLSMPVGATQPMTATVSVPDFSGSADLRVRVPDGLALANPDAQPSSTFTEIGETYFDFDLGSEPPEQLLFEVTCEEAGTFTLELELTWKEPLRCDPEVRRDFIEVTCGDGGGTTTEPTGGTVTTNDPDLLPAATTLAELGATPTDIGLGLHTSTDTTGCLHSTGQDFIPQATDETGIKAWYEVELTYDEPSVASIFNDPGAPYSCGSHPGHEVLCFDDQPLYPGEHRVYAMVLHDSWPQVMDENYYQIGFVFDYNSDAYDNYEAPPNYPADFFDQTDTWYTANFDPITGWYGSATWADYGNLANASTTSRIVVLDNAVIALVPFLELPEPPQFRFTTFRHEGDWGYASPWSCDLERPVGEPLLPVIP